MYLNDLLDTLNRGEKPDLSKSELRQIFQKDKPLNDSQRLDLFHRLCLRNQGGINLTQQEVAEITGVGLSTVKQYDTGRLNV